MTVFALVHGGAHGAWCWDDLVPELARLGHSAVTPTLPIEDVEAGNSAYADTIVESLADAGDDVVLVGHSMGGLCLPLTASRRRFRAMVFLCAMVPVMGLSWFEDFQEHPEILPFPFDDVVFDEQGRGTYPWPMSRKSFFSGCTEDQARAAWTRLRSQAFTPMTEVYPLTEWPDVPTFSVVTTDDTCVAVEPAREWSKKQLGKEAIELPGGHSPFLERPRELAETLDRLLREI